MITATIALNEDRHGIGAMRKEIEQLKLMLLELYADPGRVTTATPKYKAFHRAAMMLCGEYRLYDDVDWRTIEKNLLHCQNAYLTSGEAAEIKDALDRLLQKECKYTRLHVAGEGWESYLHPEILRVAEPRMVAGQYADAVESAFKELNNAVKNKVRSKFGREEDGQSLMQQAFSLKNPILMVEANLDTQTNKDTQAGYMMMFAGAMSAIRNPKAHENMTISKNDAVRKLMFASMLMYKLDASKLATNRD